MFKATPANVDIVFVHGLNGHPENTWKSDKSKTFWPLQLLPPILEEQKSRILVYGYDADVTSFTDGVGRDKIHNHAEHLVADLVANRRVRLVQRRVVAGRKPAARLSLRQIRKAVERPIIFVAHSLGGLVVKRVSRWCLLVGFFSPRLIDYQGLDTFVRNSRVEDGSSAIDFCLHLWNTVSWHSAQGGGYRKMGVSTGTNLRRSDTRDSIRYSSRFG